MRTYSFDYTVTAYGRTRAALKKLKAYSLNDACRRLAAHACKKWAEMPVVEVRTILVDSNPINPDLKASCDFQVSCEVSRQYLP